MPPKISRSLLPPSLLSAPQRAWPQSGGLNRPQIAPQETRPSLAGMALAGRTSMQAGNASMAQRQAHSRLWGPTEANRQVASLAQAEQTFADAARGRGAEAPRQTNAAGTQALLSTPFWRPGQLQSPGGASPAPSGLQWKAAMTSESAFVPSSRYTPPRQHMSYAAAQRREQRPRAAAAGTAYPRDARSDGLGTPWSQSWKTPSDMLRHPEPARYQNHGFSKSAKPSHPSTQFRERPVDLHNPWSSQWIGQRASGPRRPPQKVSAQSPSTVAASLHFPHPRVAAPSTSSVGLMRGQAAWAPPALPSRPPAVHPGLAAPARAGAPMKQLHGEMAYKTAKYELSEQMAGMRRQKKGFFGKLTDEEWAHNGRLDFCAEVLERHTGGNLNYVLAYKGKPAGMLSMSVPTDETKGVKIHGLLTLPGTEGVGREAMKQAIRLSLKEGRRGRVDLEYLNFSGSHEVYKHWGFVDNGDAERNSMYLPPDHAQKFLKKYGG